jgi:uncharacterized protein YbjT (DUF2867 family)
MVQQGLVMVAGATGFVGTWTVTELLKAYTPAETCTGQSMQEEG